MDIGKGWWARYGARELCVTAAGAQGGRVLREQAKHARGEQGRLGGQGGQRLARLDCLCLRASRVVRSEGRRRRVGKPALAL